MKGDGAAAEERQEDQVLGLAGGRGGELLRLKVAYVLGSKHCGLCI